MIRILDLPYLLYFITYMVMGAIIHGIWRYHQTKRLLLPHMLYWFGCGALRCFLMVFSPSIQAWIDLAVVSLALQVLVGVAVSFELLFFIRSFRTFMVESIEIRTGSYKEIISTIAEFVAHGEAVAGQADLAEKVASDLAKHRG